MRNQAMLCAFLLLSLCTFLVPVVAASHAHHHPPRDVARQGDGLESADLTALLSMVSGITSGKDASWTSATAACSWQGVTCNTSSGAVDKVRWGYMNLQGTLDLTELPAHLSVLSVNTNQLTGLQINWLMLPSALNTLDLSSNSFASAPNFDALPSTLQLLDLSVNQFTGTPNLAALPASLTTLNLDTNLFCGNTSSGGADARFVGVQGMCIGGIDGVWSTTSNALSCPVCTPLPHQEDLGALVSMVSGFESGQDPSWTVATPSCNWRGVTCTNTIVTAIGWGGLNINGTVNLTLVPRFTTQLYLDQNQLSGTIDNWAALPAYLAQFDLSNNALTGTVDLLLLPPTLQQLDLSVNQFTGTPNLVALPASLTTLNLGYNLFCGDILSSAAAALFVGVQGMCIGGIDGVWSAALSCPVCTPHPHQEDLDALVSMVSGFEGGQDPSWTAATPSCNWRGVTCTNTIVTAIGWGGLNVNGTVSLAKVPRFTTQLYLDQNQLTGPIDNWSALPSRLVSLDLSNNIFTGDVNAESLPTTMQSMYLNSNNFTGSPNLSLLPASLSTVNLGYNHFCGVIKASNATYNAIDANYMCTGGVSPQWVPMSTTFVCPPCV